MNRRCLSLSFLIVFTLLSTPAFADLKSANRQTILNDTTDFLSTIGKDGQDKKEILQERREIRRDARLKAEARRKRAETRKRMQQQQDAMMQKINAPSN
jgi:hypothetical protein